MVNNNILLYTTPNGAVRIEVYIGNETVWLTQKAIAELFGVQRLPLPNIFWQRCKKSIG